MVSERGIPLKPTELSPETLQAIERRRQGGESAASLAREFDLAPTSLRAYLDRRGLANLNVHITPADSPLNPTDARIISLERQLAGSKQESSHWRRMYNASLREASTQDLLIDLLNESISAAPALKPRYSPPQKLTTGSHTAIAIVSDVHVGEVVAAEEVRGMAEYSLDTFRRRAKLWAQKTLELVELRRSRLRVDDLVLLFLGDIVSGLIHDELNETNAAPIMDQVVIAATEFAQHVSTLSQEFRSVQFHGIPGNHGRTGQRKHFKGRYSSFDTLVYHYLQLHLQSQPNITFHLPKSPFDIVNVYGVKILYMHGDNIKGWAGFPWYGVDRAQKRLREVLAMTNDSFDIVAMGHFHTPLEVEMPTGPMIVNGSFPGGSEYSLGAIHSMTRPSQTLFYIHETKGYVGRELLYLD